MFSSELIQDFPVAIKFLTGALLKNKLANSYVFIGNNTNDTFKVVLNLAKILNCKQNRIFSTPCEKCINCKWLEKSEHPQALIHIKPDIKSKKEQIKIDAIRELLNSLNITSDYFRVVFFESSDINSLVPESANLLLKNIEESKEQMIFIFANTTKNDILPTILSRSQIIYLSKKHELFKPMEEKIFNPTSDNLRAALEKAKYTEEYLTKSNITLKDFLINLAFLNYEQNKYLDLKSFCKTHTNISSAYLKAKSFMQNKIVLEDLFITMLV